LDEDGASEDVTLDVMVVVVVLPLEFEDLVAPPEMEPELRLIML
jgi:hypothetical protein